MLGRVVALAALGGFLFGYDLGLIGGAMLGISDAFHVSEATKEAIVGATKLGAFFGTFIGGVCMLRYGRRKAISLQAAFFVAGPALMAAAPGPAALVVGRLLVGLGIGASAIVVPAYLAEIAPAKSRGMVVQMYEVMLTLGMLAAVLVNLGLSAAAGAGAWRWMVGLPAIPGAFLLASLVSLPESPRWLVMRGQLDAALATLHTIIASSSSKGRRRGRSWRARQAAMQQVRAAADAAAGLPQDPAGAAAAAEDAAWLNAAPEAGRPRNAEQQALEAAEDELLLLWSSVQKEQAAGLELRQAATGAAGPCSGAGSSNGTAPGGADGQVVVSTTATTTAAGHGMGAQHQQFSVQAAPAAAFSLDGEEDHSHPAHSHHHQQQQQQTGSPQYRNKQQQQQQQQQHERAHPANGTSSSSDAAPELDGYMGGGSHKGGGTARLKALQQKLNLPGRGVGAGADAEGQQQLLGVTALNSSSSSSHLPHAHASQQHQPQQPVSIQPPAASAHHNQQQQPGLKKRLVEPGQESNVLVSLWAMLCDVRAVARGPEAAAFGIACCLAVFDQATASTAIINYAPEVLANRMGVQDPNLAIMYPAAIALAKVVGTLIAAVTVDKYGRRPLLFWGGVGCAVFLGLAGVALATSSVALFLAALCLFIFSFSMSWAGLYWVVVSEIFSMGAKSPATSAATSLLFLTGAAVNFVYLSLIGWIGGLAFALFGVVAAGSAWYVWVRVPETKGRTLAEIQALLSPAAAAAAEVGGSRGASPRGRGLGDGPGSPMLPVVAQENSGGSRLVELRQLMPSREPLQQ